MTSPSLRDIDGKYLDATESEIKKHFDKFRVEWATFGITLMCDSWTGPIGMSVINFIVYCNGVMFFHKSIDATGHSQDASYLMKVILLQNMILFYFLPCHYYICVVCMQEIRKVVRELGPKNVVQIITDNGSNYRKACKLLRLEYPTIVWQPCVAHTINLMLKEVGKRPDHDYVIESARRICRWLYNHSALHAMMKTAIGGELVKWNGTRFGTNYMFLDN